jgi:hypothetical protein
VIGEIYTIFGGVAGGSESNSAKKAYTRRMQSKEVYSLQRLPKSAKTELMVLSFSEEECSTPYFNSLIFDIFI